MEKKDKQILFFINNIPPDYGGGYLRAFKMASRFKEKNQLSGIITLSKRKRFIKSNNGISLNDIIFLRTKLFIAIELFIVLFRKRKCFDVIYIVSSHWYTLFAVFICRMLNKKVIVGITLSGVDSPASKSSNFLVNLYYKIKNIQFKFANKIIVNSPAVLQECLELGFSRDEVKLMVNPVDIAKFKPIASNRDKIELRRQLGLPLNNPTILFVGSVNCRKGADNFNAIFQKLNERIENRYTFVICGDLNHLESEGIIGDIKKVFDNSKNDFFLFENSNCVEKFLGASDIFIFPTTNEGLPNVIIEAMAMEKIIISNTLPNITDFLLPAEFLVKHNNIDEYVVKLKKYILEPNDVKDIVKLNYNRIINEFTFDKIDNQFQKLIH
jgi:glycosyltransferase involved in cell wall biosynthesis